MKLDSSNEDWAAFQIEWRRCKRCTQIDDRDVADQLFQCCERALGRLLLKENPDIIEAGEGSLLAAMKKMAVIKVAISVRRSNLLALKKDHGETFREFFANVCGLAATCNFKIQCHHDCCTNEDPSRKVDYTSKLLKMF